MKIAQAQHGRCRTCRSRSERIAQSADGTGGSDGDGAYVWVPTALGGGGSWCDASTAAGQSRAAADG